ncbi:type VII secretion integral membrane protein EccD [Micromonospora sp. NPDC050397]|uniref:type VII secretion integral membrane protein EccD n=1 Tax=Micromonospora sp. NPDC050397 TaxID=3364279 RepID=UPI0038500293
MTIVANGEMCRLVVCGPDRQVEVAVPAQVLVADLLPALLHHLGENLADTGLLHSGWVLQRLGSPPFDEDGTVASLGLRDGEVVHLRPRSEQIPPVDFDDLIDGIATGAQARAGRWRPEMIRWASLGLLVTLFGVGLAVLALAGPPVPRAITAGALALACLVTAFALTRAGGDRAFGLVCAFAAIGYAGLAGILLLDLDAATTGTPFTGPHVFAASVAALAVAAIGLALVGWAGPLFSGLITAGLLAAAGAALAAFVPLAADRASAVVAVAATVAGTAVPMLAFRLAGLRLAPLPTEPEHLQEEIDPEPSEPLLARTAVADRYMSALYAGLAAVTGAALVLVGTAGGWASITLVLLVTLVRLLAARPMNSGWHRLWMAAPALAGVVAVTLHVAATAQPLGRLLVPAALVPVGAAVLTVIARTMPGRRMMPYWGRIGDLAQTVTTVAMFPVLLAVLGVYGYARALGG